MAAAPELLRSRFVGVWGTGPFDNDVAEDWRFDFLDLSPAGREAAITAAFSAAASDPLAEDLVQEAIAAAAVLSDATSAPAELRLLGVRAMERLLGSPLPPESLNLAENLRKALTD